MLFCFERRYWHIDLAARQVAASTTVAKWWVSKWYVAEVVGGSTSCECGLLHVPGLVTQC